MRVFVTHLPAPGKVTNPGLCLAASVSTSGSNTRDTTAVCSCHLPRVGAEERCPSARPRVCWWIRTSDSW